MDFKLAALKLTSGQMKDVLTSRSGMTFGGTLFQRAWVQGTLVAEIKKGYFYLDDGTGIIELQLSNEHLLRNWKIGMYVMVVGLLVMRTSESPLIRVHKMVDLYGSPDREAMWYLEVIEAYKLFYDLSFEE
ncbi:hypothetical protein C5167_001321 [Papaver somniferum]|uniref:OB domain-containing protein n=1 Tax=Papaver somniferum TaxID=3469 RepID=A0A4Y7KXM1_PAPSO|nr:uncharacterized protein LOC113310824 [Papaver somniferum]RZC77132.1 hypothetical protein C5167_001321 [Papaver somniferum]